MKDAATLLASQPDYVPPHRAPCWLSSEDVKDAIRALADEGTNKAACWDFMQAIYQLQDRAHAGEG